jgi:putative ABC transport system permease protein
MLQRRMKMLRLRLRSLFRRGRVESELDRELRSHIDQQTEENIAAGMTPEQARLAALRAFGGTTQRREECRDARAVNVVEHLAQDVRYALRALRRDPVLTLVAGLSLAICIGANTTIFSIVDTILLRPLPYPNAGQLYWVSELLGRPPMEVAVGGDYFSLSEQNRVFSSVAAYDTTTVNWTGVEKPEQVDVAQVTSSFFRVFGTSPFMGRYLAAREDGPQPPGAVVLSYSFWRNRLGGDPHVLGKTLTLDRQPCTVIGVMPQGFDYPKSMQMWKPFDLNEAEEKQRERMRLVSIVARRRPGVSEPQLAAEIKRLTGAVRAEYPKEYNSGGFLAHMAIQATPLQRRMTGDLRPALLVLTGAVGLVLLIACVNLASLLLARAAARQRELAVRLALGSARGRIVRQMLTESIVLALPGGLGGIVVAFLAVAGLNAWKPLVLINYPAIALDFPTLAATFGVTVVTGVAFGMAPALTAARLSIQDGLRGEGSSVPAARARKLLVVAELAVSLVLLIGAGLLVRSFVTLARTNLGFPPEHLLTLRVNLVPAQYPTGAKQVRFYDDVLERVRRLPGVRDAAVTTDVPLDGLQPWSAMAFDVVGHPPVPRAQRPQTGVSVVSPNFFHTFGIPLRRGRLFDAHDTPETIVVDENFARTIFPGEDPIGRRIKGNGDPLTIAGVVGTISGDSLAGNAPVAHNNIGSGPLSASLPRIYHCDCTPQPSPFLGRMALVVRTAGDPRAAIRPVEDQVYAVDRNQPVFAVKTMDELLDESLAPARFHVLLLGVFAAIAVALAAIGVYGVMSYLVTWRTREIGIRVAMGARPGVVARRVVGESVALAVLAALGGLAGAWALTRYVRSMLYGVTALDPITFVVAPLALVVVVAAAAFGPAWRAARVDPMEALRHE